MKDINDLIGLDLRIGRITKVSFFSEARIPAYKLELDFGETGTRQSSAQLTRRYNEKTLLNRKVVAALGLPPKRIAGFTSECLVMGAIDDQGDVILLEVPDDTPIGWKVL